jgi:hypothetical protein
LARFGPDALAPAMSVRLGKADVAQDRAQVQK